MVEFKLPHATRMAALGLLTFVAASFGSTGTLVTADDDITVDVRLTYYHATGDPMYNGVYPYPGAAACSWDFPLGTILATANGDVLTCADRGMLPERWVDVFVHTPEEGTRLANQFGPYTRMRVLAWGDDTIRPTVINRPKGDSVPKPATSPEPAALVTGQDRGGRVLP